MSKLFFLVFLLFFSFSSSSSLWKFHSLLSNPSELNLNHDLSQHKHLFVSSPDSKFADYFSTNQNHLGRNKIQNPMINNIFLNSDMIPFPSQSHGTTTLIVKYRDSLIITVDSKSSMKNYIVSDSVKKIRTIGGNYIATMAGGASDCHYFLSKLGKKIKKAESFFGRKLPLGLIVKLLVDDIYNYSYLDLSIGTMLAGLDNQGPRLFYIDSEANFIEGDYFSVGSGCQWAYAVLDSYLEEQLKIKTKRQTIKEVKDQNIESSFDDLDEDSVVNLCRQAVQEACRRDLFSGGYINSLKLNSTGIYPLSRFHFDSIPE